MSPVPTRSSLPPVLSIAGSDCSAGAGIQADLKTFSACGVHGLTAVTCVVAEVPGRVDAVEAVSVEILSRQISMLFEHYPITAVKTGMLYSRPHIEAVAAGLPADIPLVVDPVMVASSGDALLLPDAIGLYRECLFPRAAVMTPNLDEAGFLLNRRIESEDELEAAARELRDTFGCPVLLKGGHLRGAEALDILVPLANDDPAIRFTAPFVHDVDTHGSGCTYSAAIAAHLGRGAPLVDSVRAAKDFVTRAIRGHHRWKVGDAAAVDALDQTQAGDAPARRSDATPAWIS